MAKSKTNTKSFSSPPSPKTAIKANEVLIPFQKESFWAKNLIPAIVLMVITFGLYFQSIHYGYVLDDLIVIEENKFTKQGLAGIKNIMTTESMTGYFGEQKNLVQGNRYRPLSLVTFAIEYEFHKKLNPKTSHFINILLYAITGIILFMTLFLLFGHRNKIPWLGLPFLASLIFIIHPIHVEAVANIKGRDEIMALLFSLASLYAALRYSDNFNNKWLIISPLLLMLGLLSKENAITFVAVIPLTLYFFNPNTKKGIGMITMALLGVTIMYLMIRFSYSGVPKINEVSKDIMNNPFLGMTFIEKMSTIFYTLGKYILLLFFPHPLTHDYYPYAIPKMNIGNPYVLVSLGLYIFMIWYIIKSFFKKNIETYSVLYYLLTLSIVSNIVVNLGTFMNDRFIFMASVGFCIFLVYLLTEKVQKLPITFSKYLGFALLGTLIIFYSFKTYSRVPDWENALTLNKSAIKVSKNSARANSFMATALYNEYKDKENIPIPERLAILKEALPYAQKACEILPEYYNGNIMEAGLVGEIFRLDGDMSDFLTNIKNVMLRRPDLPYLKEYSEHVISQGYYQKELYDFYLNIGIQLMSHRKYSKFAIQYLLFAYRLNPEGEIINEWLYKAYEKQGDMQNAQKYLMKVN
jgi:hypothetical protein